MKSNNTSLFKHVDKTLSFHRWIMALLLAFFISLFFAIISLNHRIDSDQQLISTLSPYISTLVESSDRPEMLRIIETISEQKQADVFLVQDGSVIATNKELSVLDMPFQKQKLIFSFLKADFTSTHFILKSEVKRAGYPSQNTWLYIMTPVKAAIRNTLLIFAFIFLLGLPVSLYSSRITQKAIKKALLPLDQLHSEIKGLSIETEITSEPIYIKELEEIRHTIGQTKVDLENAKDRLAEEKAKKLSAESYKRLIHDLHNPVAALRQMIRVANDSLQDWPTKVEATSSIARIADQILNQVTAAKKNLEMDAISLRDSDLLVCVNESIAQVKAVSLSKLIISEIPKSEIILPHDPALLKRALINLLENGLEAASNTVRISIFKKEDTAFIKICDDGPGMDETQIPIYFQGRGQSGKAKRQAFGLSSTNHIIRSHGGKLIYRKSDLGGSSFEIRLGVI